MLESVLSVLSGGLTGVIGSAVTHVVEYKTKQLETEQLKIKNAHEVAMRQADAAIMREEWAARTQVASIEADARVEAEDAKAFAVSMTPEHFLPDGAKLTKNQTWIMVCLEAIRGAVRPVLTMYLCVLTTLVYWQLSDSLKATPAVFQASMQEAVATVLYLTSTCVSWWFGSRFSQNRRAKKA